MNDQATMRNRLPQNGPILRLIRANETIKKGDYWLLNEKWNLIEGACRYDPGCCTGLKQKHSGIQHARLMS